MPILVFMISGNLPPRMCIFNIIIFQSVLLLAAIEVSRFVRAALPDKIWAKQGKRKGEERLKMELKEIHQLMIVGGLVVINVVSLIILYTL